MNGPGQEKGHTSAMNLSLSASSFAPPCMISASYKEGKESAQGPSNNRFEHLGSTTLEGSVGGNG